METAPMHRPMRQASRLIRKTDQLRAVVDACHTVRIGVVDREGMFIVPMSFGYDWADPETPGNPSPFPAWRFGFTPPGRGARSMPSSTRRAWPSRWTSRKGSLQGRMPAHIRTPIAASWERARSIASAGSRRSATGWRASWPIWRLKQAQASPIRPLRARTSTASTLITSPASCTRSGEGPISRVPRRGSS